MDTTTDLDNALAKEWNKQVSGTYSSTDKKIFERGFTAGWNAGRNALREKVTNEQTPTTSS